MGGVQRGRIEEAPTAWDGVLESAYAAYGADVRRFAIYRSRDASLADDVVQDAFVRLYGELVAGRSPSNVPAWLRRVAANLLVSQTRHERVVRRCGSLLVGGTTASIEDIALGHERDQAVLAALPELRPEERQVLLLAASGLRGPEIAIRVGRSHAAVRVLLCRARRHLRERVVRSEALALSDQGQPATSSGCPAAPSAVSI